MCARSPAQRTLYGRRMLFRQVIHDDLGCASCLVGHDEAAIAAVVDPRVEIDVYLDLARYTGVRIEHSLETHDRVDHGSRYGRQRAGHAIER
jgi:hydroxyacylglutathione hydrolase